MMNRIILYLKRKLAPAPEPEPEPESAPVPQQKPDCHLLNLPEELVLAIANTIPPTQRLHLAHTCRCLYKITEARQLHQDLNAPPGPHRNMAVLPTSAVPRRDRLDYLSVLARHEIDSWLCEACCKLHTVFPPEFSYFMGDEGFGLNKRHVRRTKSRKKQVWLEYSPKPLVVTYREVQLFLKYTRVLAEERKERIEEEESRMTCYSREVFERLMKPRKLQLHFGYLGGFFMFPASFTCYAAPKIIKDSDGEPHYVMLYVYESYISGPISKNPYADNHLEWVCPHLRLSYAGHREMIERAKFQMDGDPRLTNHQQRLQERYGDDYFWPNFHGRPAIRKEFDNSRESQELETKTARGKKRHEKRRNKKALKKKKRQEKKGNKNKDEEKKEGPEGAQGGLFDNEEAGDDDRNDRDVLTSCHRCPTDITHRGTRTYVYRDFGPEGSVTSKAWQIQVRGRRDFFGDQEVGPQGYIVNGERNGVAVYHRPGSIEAMYEGLLDVPATDGAMNPEVVMLH